MVIDTSALAAILFDEPDASYFQRCIVEAPVSVMSAVALTEFTMLAAARGGPEGAAIARSLVTSLGIAVTAVDEALAHAATEAFLRFGKGRHRARLNFGDCFSYALASSCGEALLFKGDDFSRTDIASVARRAGLTPP